MRFSLGIYILIYIRINVCMVNLNIYSSNTSNASAKLTLQELNTSNITLSYPNDIISIPSVSSVQIPGSTDEYMVFNYTGDNTNTVGQTVYNISIPENYSADILMVGGGGGGGGDIGGGGGGGAVLYGSNIIIPAGSYNIKVGAGGTGRGVNGYNTEAFGSVCLGGGAAKNKAMYPSIPNDSNLLAWYRFNGDAIDYNPTSTKYELTPTITPTYSTELLQGRKYLNTLGNGFTNAALYLKNRAFSISCWVRPTSANGHSIVTQSQSQNTNLQFIIGWRGSIINYYMQFYANDIECGQGTGTATSYPGDLNTWVHLVFVVEANYNRKIYRNGILISFDNNTSAFAGTANLSIGSGAADTSDLRIYGVAIPATEVAAMYSSYINGGITDNSAGSNAGNNGGSGAGGRTVNTTANGSFGAGGTVGTSTKSSLLTAATLYQGSSGGTGVTATTGSTNYILSGGGGGATAVGTAGKSAASTAGTGTGGDGVPLNITGTTFWWGAGGGAGGYATAAGNGGRGGAGSGTSSGTGGTNGTVGTNGFNAASGLNAGYGTGSGGGGGNIITTMSGGTGGSGVVIMRYRRLNEGMPEIYFLREGLPMSGYTNHKIGNYNGDFQIKSLTSNIDRTVLAIQNGGNIGIGTSAPINNLHIYSSNNANASAKLTIQELNTSNYALTYPNDIASYPFVPSISISGTIDKYMIFTYTSDTTGAGQTQYSINVPEPCNCDILIVGGGGAGGTIIGGGGGSGSIIYASGFNISDGTYTINVGRGGVGAVATVANSGIVGGNGSSSSAFDATAIGGGGGGWYNGNGGISGGSGGGCGGGVTQAAGGAGGSGGLAGSKTIGGTIIPSATFKEYLCNDGGFPFYYQVAGNSWSTIAGGGGGANALGGGTPNSGTKTSANGDGGAGKSYNITGTSTTYGGGGGGGSHRGALTTISNPTNGTGGIGGGGNGGNDNAISKSGDNGIDGTGGGGGGSANNNSPIGIKGGNGGSGIVIIRYRRVTERGNPEIQLISGNSLLTGSNNYKIGNYNGDFKIKSSTSNVDIDKFTIQGNGNIVINETLGNEAKLTIQNTRQNNEIISTPSITTSLIPTSTDRFMAFPYTTDTAALGQTNYTISMTSGFYDILMVGGGGAGGKDIGGGGGGAAVLYATNVFITTGSYDIKVGRGATPGETRGKSTEGFGAVILGGGSANNSGWGVNTSVNGNMGGSGGGGKGTGGGTSVAIGGVPGISPIGTIFGSSYTIYNGNNGGSGMMQVGGSQVAGGGGGGAGGIGINANTSATTYGGAGGDGIPINITGTTFWWGAGGGGGVQVSAVANGANGGKGGGGGGGPGTVSGGIFGTVGSNGYGIASGKNAGAGTGSGGGGAGYTDMVGGNGGSGIIIIRYRSGNSSIELIRGAIGDNNTDYKIGNYGGDFKIISSSTGTDTDRVIINSAGYLLINGFKQPFSRCGAIINNPNFIDIPVLFDITNTNVHTCEIKLHWLPFRVGTASLSIFGYGTTLGSGSLITPSETSFKTTGVTSETQAIQGGNTIASTVEGGYDSSTSIRICKRDGTVASDIRHHYICDSVYCYSNVGAANTVAKGFINTRLSGTNYGNLSFVRITITGTGNYFSIGNWTATYYHI
jgi:hypothetical protein